MTRAEREAEEDRQAEQARALHTRPNHESACDRFWRRMLAAVREDRQAEASRVIHTDPAAYYPCPRWETCGTLLGRDQVNDEGINECLSCGTLSRPPAFDGRPLTDCDDDSVRIFL